MPDSLTPSTPCPICGGAAEARFPGQAWALREGGRAFRYAACPACGVMFSDPLPTPEEITWLYTHRYDYEWFRQRRGLKRVQAWHRWRRLRAQLAELGIPATPRRLLDIGGGHAWFLRAAQKAGWQADGLELLSDAQLAEARALGLTIHHGTLLAAPPGLGAYDLVTMWHVLEHIIDPRAAFAALVRLLAPGGVCVIAVPNLDATGYQRAGADWVWCQKPFIHPLHFSPRALEKLLPADLELLSLTSRDTWDGQAFETTALYAGIMKAIYYACRAPRKAALLLRLTPLARLCDRLQFWLEEGFRLASYAVYLALRPLLSRGSERALRGSELLLITRRKTTPGAAR
jgi:SAM-dependent methyltransferase